MDTLLSFLIPLSPIIINIVCIIFQKGKIISLIATVCGAVPALLLLALNSGYGIGFGNPWIGVDWGLTVVFLLYISALLATHAFVPSSGKIKIISVIIIVLVVICTLLLTGLHIIDSIDHR